MKRIAHRLAIALLGTLSACGGGGDGSTASAVVDKYVGTWSACQAVNDSNLIPPVKSVRVSMIIGVFAKVSDATAQVAMVAQSYPFTTNCTGDANPSQPVLSTGTATFVGVKNVGNEVVDKFDLKVNQESAKSIFVIRSDGKLYTGIGEDEPGASFDAQGYPDKIDTNSALIKLMPD